MKKNNQTKSIVDSYAQDINFDMVNEILAEKDMTEFEMNKNTLNNIADWALNGESNEEIRKRLNLKPNQWKLLVSICPTLVYVMKSSRALADMVVAGSLFQTAIGGKRIKKEVPVKVKEYNERGYVCGEHYETIEIWEELPPNPHLLKFIAEHKLSTNFGESKGGDNTNFKKVVENMTPEERALIELMSKEGKIDA